MNRKLFADIAILAMRRMLPRDWDFCVVAWRMTAETELEMTSVSQGNPAELEIVLAEVLKELKLETAREPADALH